MQMTLNLSSLSQTEMEQAFYRKDASYDGLFFVAVRTTGIFCRPSCPSRPKLENVEFFASLKEAMFSGYRPCQRCHPCEVYGALPNWVESLMQKVEDSPSTQITAVELKAMGISPERARRWFKTHLGMTFTEWCRGRRLAGALTQLRQGVDLDQVVFEQGYDSHSGFRSAFEKTFGITPGQSQTGEYIAAQLLATPLGPLLVCAVTAGICLVEFSDRRMLEHNYAMIQKLFGHSVLPVSNSWIDQLKNEVSDYFQGELKSFSVPIVTQGTPFQKMVWQALQTIPYGDTISYDELAQQINQPTASRAVARANGMNRISLLIPCHRVIGKDGSLTGYGGGVWRKRLLLELERRGAWPRN